MAKPDSPPGQSNGNNTDDEHVVIVATEDSEHRFEGTSTLSVNGGCLLVGKTPIAAFAAGEWIRAWVEALVVDAP